MVFRTTLVIAAMIVAFAATIVATNSNAQQAPTHEEIARLGVEFKSAYLPGGRIPIKPTAIAIHRWEQPIRIEIDSQSAAQSASAGVTEEVVPQLQDLLARTMGQRPEIVSDEARANVLIVVGSPEVVVAHLSAGETVEKYFGGWDLGLGEFTSLVNQSGCAFDFLSGPNGQIRSGIIVIMELSDPLFTKACLQKGIVRVIGFEGSITDRKSIFASDARNVELKPGDENVIRVLYGKTLRAGDPLSDVIHNLQTHVQPILELEH